MSGARPHHTETDSDEEEAYVRAPNEPDNENQVAGIDGFVNERLAAWSRDRQAFTAKPPGFSGIPRKQVDYELVHYNLSTRSGDLQCRVPLPVMVSILNEIWEEEGLY
eukprot:c13136_g1_i2.p1 GENE.c13136_g1_i2~~c13136_g1_i2.p1  ORF type:complete len:122 (+),score=17.40 c13136_g1_i2:43-366(+)